MTNYIKLISTFIGIVFFISCGTGDEEPELSGVAITGKVSNGLNGEPIANAAVSLSGAETKSQTTGSDGLYRFDNLTIGTYSIEASHPDYQSNGIEITIQSLEVAEGDITLQPNTSLELTPTQLDFGTALSEREITIRNNSGFPLNYELQLTSNWVSVSKSQGSLPSLTQDLIRVNIDREQLNVGTHESSIVFNIPGRGSQTVEISAEKLNPTSALLSIDEGTLNFGEDLTSATIELSNVGSGALSWTLDVTEDWLSANPVQGSLQPGDNTQVEVFVIRDGLVNDDYTGFLNFSGSGGEAVVQVLMTVNEGTGSSGNPNLDDDNDGVINLIDADDDGDGLIDIYTINDLDNIRNDLNASGTGLQGLPITGAQGYELMNDLDFDSDDSYSDLSLKSQVTSGAGWVPIGLNVSGGFSAIFEGNGFTISNLFINRTTSYSAFFESTEFLAEIRNLHLDIRFLSGDQLTAGLVGSNEADITSCSVTGVISNSTSYSGMLIGRHVQGTIQDSYAEGSITSSGFNTGGFIGEISGFNGDEYEVIRCYANVNVSSGNQTSGGFIGDIGGGGTGTISSCYATGDVVASSTWAGGFIGQASGTILNCYATGSVTSSSNHVGGFAGQNYGGIINSCYSIGTIDGSSSVGGFMGSGSAIATDNYWDTTTSGIGTSAGGTGLTTTQLQGSTSNTGIFITWSADAWDFGSSTQYPALRDMPGGIEKQR